jgi:hypothetical protein
MAMFDDAGYALPEAGSEGFVSGSPLIYPMPSNLRQLRPAGQAFVFWAVQMQL